MAPIDKIEGLKAAPGLSEVEATEALSGAAAITPAAATSATADPIVALFEAAAAQIKAGALASREAALEAAVSEVLALQLPFIDAPTRAALSVQISAQLWAHPELSQRVNRLLG
ncbi:hypothetical protein KKF91_15470 [Myxococcota bacterium]|nr:hypothetical protein [Myxococcota bacterium]MBU1431940.1 hypothetical protein [Myxococcota bacterium]MBU1897164.1 hypothetical protein [Myxococcota bacterium]